MIKNTINKLKRKIKRGLNLNKNDNYINIVSELTGWPYNKAKKNMDEIKQKYGIKYSTWC